MRIVVGMATTNKRRSFAIQAMDSLAPYVDEIRLYDNDREVTDYTDNAKFYFLQEYKEPIYYLSCDDDIIYPADYVAKTIEAIEKYECIVTYHGRRLRGLNRDYYREHYGYRAFGFVPQDTLIDIAGTGVAGFRTDMFNPTEIYKAKEQKMADCVFSLEAAKQGIDIMVLRHQEDWLQGLPVPLELTIYHQVNQMATKQMEIANEIYKLRYETNKRLPK